MTNREELKAKAIEVMMDGADAQPRDFWRAHFAAAFDALGAAGFSIIGPDITDEMVRANGALPHNTPFGKRFLAMVAAADLTKVTNG
jgi:hypothetical protein